jgi:membrane protease YdiL (CAAX protease family)
MPVLPRILTIATAGITEEILFRGYLLERLGRLAGGGAVGVLGSQNLVACMLVHLLNDGLAAFVFAPSA